MIQTRPLTTTPSETAANPVATTENPAVRKILIGAAAVGLLGDQMLRTGFTGIGPMIWALCGLLALAAVSSSSSAARPERGVLLGILTVLALTLGIRDSEELTAFAVLGMVGFAALTAAILRGDTLRSLRDVPFVDAAFGVAGSLRSVAFGAIPLLLRDVRGTTLGPSVPPGSRAAVIRGIVIALPIIAVLGALFVSADPTFEALASSLRLDPGELVGHIVLTGILAWIAAGLYRHAAAIGVDSTVAPRRDFQTLGPIEIGIVLGAMNALFTIFVALQLPRMFAGEEFILRQTGLTYASYARRGFFELVAASGLTLGVLVAIQSLARPTDEAKRMLRILGTLMVGLVLLILDSALHRLALYVQAYGWSVDRIHALAIIAWLAITFGWSVSTLLGRNPRRFVIGSLGSGVALLFTLFAINPEAIAIRRNAARASDGHSFDFAYVARSLSRDAIPAFAAVLPTLPSHARPDAESCRLLASRFLNRMEGPTDWRSWTLSAARAQRPLAEISAWRSRACAGIKPVRPARVRAPAPQPSKILPLSAERVIP